LAKQLLQERGSDWFDNYHRFDEMKQWYSDLAQQYSNLVTFIPSIGKSAQGRDLFALKITGTKASKKPQIWIQGQIHAREWISGITVQFIVNDLVSNYGKDSEATQILDQSELLVVPIQNPDGYEYTVSLALKND
jgi:murein tripeptide amidase MpaA